jgi:hypothetical protein
MIEIDPQTFQDAFEVSRSYSGMGSLKILWNPYECWWEVEINFADNSKYTSQHPNLNIALSKVSRSVRESPPKN